jgi:hypothetical protein
MKKIILLVSFVVFAFGTAFSQGRFSVGPELGIPIGTLSDVSGIGIGGSVRYEAPIQDKLNWTGTVGFLSFAGKSFFGVSLPSTTLIPIQGGVKYYFTESFNGFYASGELGLAIGSVSVTSVNFLTGQQTSKSETSTNFAFAPGAGYHVSNWDFSARFQLVSNSNYFNIRAAYVFGGK